MGRVCVLMLGAIIPVAVALAPAPRAAAQPPGQPAPLKIGLPESMFSGLPPAIVQIGAEPFKAMFQRQAGLKGEIIVVKDYADTAARLRNKTLDVAVFQGFEYPWVKQHKELVPLLVTVPRSKLQAAIVVNVQNKAAGPNQLRGDCVTVHPATKAHCRIYLERLQQAAPAGFLGTAKADTSALEDVLDEVAGGKREAVLIDTATLLAYQANKPAVGGQLKVLAQSENFPSAIIVYRDGAFTADEAKKVSTGLIKAIASPQGRGLTDLWKLKGFAEIDDGYRAEIEKSLKAYPAPERK